MSATSKPISPLILVVNDEEALREIFVDALQAAGYRAMSACDGARALKVLAKERVDLLMTDILMPEVDGMELIMQARKAHPRLKVLAMSGGGRTSAEVLINIARHLGVQRTLEKPFDPAILLREIEALVGPSVAPQG
jgi:DNA-binding response OmpR family regulator